jgi:hypothetical protein
MSLINANAAKRLKSMVAGTTTNFDGSTAPAIYQTSVLQ